MHMLAWSAIYELTALFAMSSEVQDFVRFVPTATETSHWMTSFQQHLKDLIPYQSL
jgi:hypothetical protein